MEDAVYWANVDYFGFIVRAIIVHIISSLFSLFECEGFTVFGGGERQNRIWEHGREKNEKMPPGPSLGSDEACAEFFGSLAVYSRIAGLLAFLLL